MFGLKDGSAEGSIAQLFVTERGDSLPSGQNVVLYPETVLLCWLQLSVFSVTVPSVIEKGLVT